MSRYFRRLIGCLGAVVVIAGIAPVVAASAMPLHAAMPQHRCTWHLSGSLRGSAIKIRIRNDTCSPATIRWRAVGKCVYDLGTSHYEKGNWVDRSNQLSTAYCQAHEFVNAGYQQQPRRGRVVYHREFGVGGLGPSNGNSTWRLPSPLPMPRIS